MATYEALEDCFFDGVYYPKGTTFSGRSLTGYDKDTADHYLRHLDIEDEAPAKDPNTVTAELNKLNKDALLVKAAERGLNLDASVTKADIIAAIISADEL